jgi:hypothetical protein
MTARVEPLRREHLVAWHKDKGAGPTILRGVAGFVDDQLVAVAGLVFAGGHVVAFCDLKEEARPHKTLIHWAATKLMREAKKRHKRIIAQCDPQEPGAARWLQRLGFVHEEGDLWAWQV